MRWVLFYMIKVLKGGLDPSNTTRYKFISGEVSDTRLMGVVAMHLVFEDTILKENPNQHQFYYFDYEELGLETLKIVYTNNPNEIDRNVKEAFAGLGAKLIDINEDEAYYFANWMIEDTKKKAQPLPEEVSDIQFVQLKSRELSQTELDDFNSKICVFIKSDYGVVNYYLMRSFGKDKEAADFLIDPIGEFEEIAPANHSTFLKNKIVLLDSLASMHKVYRCESLIEIEKEEKHHLIVSEIEVYKRKVVSAKKISDITVSVFEASMLLSKEEYVSVYQPKKDTFEYDLAAAFNKFSIGMTHNPHPAGEMFMDFMPNNDHAEQKIFMLSDDIRALYFLSDEGQIVTSAYNIGAILQAEARLNLSSVGEYVELTNRYKFPASIIYDFAESGFADFNEFLHSID